MASGKTDMERVGLFQEMSFVTTGDRYKTTALNFNEAATKGKQMLPGGLKERSATQAGYFQEKFGRVFEGEGYSDPIKRRRQYRMEQSKRNLGKPFLPSNGEKMVCGLGNHYGTIGGPVPAFSAVKREPKSVKAPGKNVQTNPGKKGTGYGFLGVTIGKYPNNLSDPFDNDKERARKEVQRHKSSLKGGAFRLNMHPEEFFDGNPFRNDKLPPPMGGKFGTFDPYPSHSADPYTVKVKKSMAAVNKSGKIFVPSPGPKTTPVHSIVEQNIMRSMNIQNYRAMTVA
ncbi:hypothetical protein BaRGS_00017481 [Batillaria attramentaria]|uniref:Cilia-and flagella-associated protein 96 n=1 Tax=Batillaria attramentaria TaxID=370345 RepID=A0ABD0KVL4_9CAEN